MDRPFLIEFRKRLLEKLTARDRRIREFSHRRFPKRQLFLALNDCKPLFSRKYNCPVRSRWSVGKRSKPSDTEVIEYLVDYGISRHSIPQAIRQPKGDLPELAAGERYGILLAVESEMGDDKEVARDFLKLLDVKAPCKLLVFERRRDHAALYDRLNWVLSHYANLDPTESILLLGLPLPEADDLWNVEVRCVDHGAVAEL